MDALVSVDDYYYSCLGRRSRRCFCESFGQSCLIGSELEAPEMGEFGFGVKALVEAIIIIIIAIM